MTELTPKNFVRVNTYTWMKDVHGLFDFENKKLIKNEFELSESMKMYRKVNFVLTEKELKATATEKPLFCIEKNPVTNKFSVTKPPGADADNNDDIYRIVRGIKIGGKQTGYEIRVGDHLKVGRVKFLVKEFGDEKGRKRKLPEILQDATPSQDIMEEEESNQKRICRYCLSDDISTDPVENTLICLCKCKGTCKYTHVICFRHWIDSKKKEKDKLARVTTTCICYDFKSMICEVCREPIPHSVIIHGQETEILAIERPLEQKIPYLILQNDENKEIKGLYIIYGKTIDGAVNECTMGRGTTNSIEINDISVSRNHAMIVFQDGKFRLFDKNSKFGTLVEVRDPIELSMHKTVLQCGRTVVILQIIIKEVKSNLMQLESIEMESEAISRMSTRQETDSSQEIAVGKMIEIEESCIEVRMEESDVEEEVDRGVSLIEASKKIKKGEKKPIVFKAKKMMDK